MSAFRTLDDAGDLKGKRVLVRVDLNVPTADGKVTDDTRIRAVAPTIKEIAAKGGKVILLAHFGRPKGGPEAKYSLKQVVPALVAILGLKVAFAEDCIGPAAEKAVAAMENGGVLVLENTRFHPGEEKNDPEFVAASGQARRRLRQRCVLRRAPRPRLDRRAGPQAAGLRRPCHAARDRGAADGARRLEAAGGGDHRRRQGVVQDRDPRASRRQGRRARHRRRHGQHLPPRQGNEDRQVARRTGPHRDGQSHHGRRQQGRLHDRASR